MGLSPDAKTVGRWAVGAYLLGIGTFWAFHAARQQLAKDAVIESSGKSLSGRGAGGDSGGGLHPERNRPIREGAKLSSKLTAERIRTAFHDSNPVSREIAFAQLLSQADASNIADIRAIFFEFDRSGLRYDNEWRMLWHHWATLDPEGALAQVTKETANGGGNYGAGVYALVFSAWASADPKQAAQAINSIQDPKLFEASYLGTLRGMALTQATLFAEESTFENRDFASRAAENLAERALRESNSIDELKKWYQGLGGVVKEAALDHVYWRIKTANLDDAALWVSAQAKAGTPTKRIAGEIANDFVRKDALKGIDWYLSLPADSQDPAATQALCQKLDLTSGAYVKWAASNPEKAARVASLRPAEAHAE